MLLPGGDQALEQEQLLRTEIERSQNRREDSGIEEALHSGISVDHSDFGAQGFAVGEPETEGLEARELAVELEFGSWRRVLYRHGGDARDTSSRRRRQGQRSGEEWGLGEAERAERLEGRVWGFEGEE